MSLKADGEVRMPGRCQDRWVMGVREGKWLPHPGSLASTPILMLSLSPAAGSPEFLSWQAGTCWPL